MSRDIDFTQPLNEADEAYVAQRPWLLTDAELKGIEVTYERDVFTQEDAEEDDEQDTPEDEQPVDYTKFSKDDLLAEIKRRNDEREDEEDHVVPAAPGNKPELITALQEDDELNEEEDDEE